MLKHILIGLCTTIALCSAGLIASLQSQQNNSPIVKILVPTDKSKHDLNTLVHYRIQVSDVEDGESEYDEIAANEVFLEVRYLPDASKVNMDAMATADPKGLAAMKKSNCFTCHAFNGKLIAPSFIEIAKRYPKTTANIDLLTKHIREGSTGVWGTTSMPTHTELTIEETRNIVSWLLENARDEYLNYYTGTEGNLKIKVPEGVSHKGAFVLSATYSDHGTKNNPQHFLSSKDVIVLYVK